MALGTRLRGADALAATLLVAAALSDGAAVTVGDALGSADARGDGVAAIDGIDSTGPSAVRAGMASLGGYRWHLRAVCLQRLSLTLW